MKTLTPGRKSAKKSTVTADVHSLLCAFARLRVTSYFNVNFQLRICSSIPRSVRSIRSGVSVI
jgi:hypothetical protein